MQPFDLNAFTSRLHSESDRACAILGAALLDAKLEALLRRQFRRLHKELLGSTCPIGTFATRIRLAYALDWISGDAYSDLDSVRKIRNDFAHSFDHNLSFTDSSVSDRCGTLRTAQAFIDGYDTAAISLKRNFSTAVIHAMQDVFKPPRWRFQLAIEFLAQYLDELPESTSTYASMDLLEEVRSLSANIKIKVSGTATVAPREAAPR